MILSPIDREALERSIVIARRDPAYAKSIDSKLAAGDDWFDVAVGASYHVPDALAPFGPLAEPACFCSHRIPSQGRSCRRAARPADQMRDLKNSNRIRLRR